MRVLPAEYAIVPAFGTKGPRLIVVIPADQITDNLINGVLSLAAHPSYHRSEWGDKGDVVVFILAYGPDYFGTTPREVEDRLRQLVGPDVTVRMVESTDPNFVSRAYNPVRRNSS